MRISVRTTVTTDRSEIIGAAANPNMTSRLVLNMKAAADVKLVQLQA